MQVPYRCLVACPSGERGAVAAAIGKVFAETECTFSPFAPDSELSRLNGHPPGLQWFQLSTPLCAVLRLCGDVHRESKGLFDPTVRPLLAEFHSRLAESGKVPEEAELQHVEVGWEGLDFDWDGQRVRKTAPRELDLCGVAKGWAVDALCERLSARWGPCLCDWGGDVRACGRPPDPQGRPWSAALVRPPKLRDVFAQWQRRGSQRLDGELHQYLRLIELRDGEAVATSGDYMQIAKFGYLHVMHPKRRRPLQTSNGRLCSSTAVAGSCAGADALATAMLLSEHVEPALQLAGALRGRLRARECYFYVRNHETFIACDEGGHQTQESVGSGHGHGTQRRPAPPMNPTALPQADHPLRAPALAALHCVPKQLCILSLPDSAGAGAAVVSSLHAMQLGSRAVVVFNVQHGSALAAALASRQRGAEFVAHLLTEKHADLAVSVGDGGEGFIAGLRRDPSGVLHDLAGCANRCVVDFRLPVGDHDVVVADVLGGDGEAIEQGAPLLLWRGRLLALGAAGSPPPGAARREGYSSPRSGARLLFGSAAPTAEAAVAAAASLLAAVAAAAAAGQAAPTILRGGSCSTAAIAIGHHRSEGAVGVPVLDPRLCSLAPPVLTFCSVATDAAHTVLRVGAELVVHLLSAEAEDLFAPSRVFDPARPFAYLPVPSFRPVPGSLGCIRVAVRSVHGIGGGAGEDGGLLCVAAVSKVDDALARSSEARCPVYVGPALGAMQELGRWRAP
eukprot:TRINITY_DN8036_c0_g2_i1.p1 TRINITY_DN8036_c0_g2~~TRINITY_DN8036_c0_g2_i1.p1  ORF type:complete len:837 (+),score=258.59 TRINITY_DN8036_c0_g2_i1:309-2513(+)